MKHRRKQQKAREESFCERIKVNSRAFLGPPRCLSGKEPSCQFKSCGFAPWVGETLEKEMATHSNIFIWEIPGTKEPGKL